MIYATTWHHCELFGRTAARLLGVDVIYKLISRASVAETVRAVVLRGARTNGQEHAIEEFHIGS